MTRVYPAVRAPCVSVFSCDLYHFRLRPLQVRRGLLESVGFSFRQNLCTFPASLSFFPLFPVFGISFRQIYLQYTLPTTVSPKMALTFTTGLLPSTSGTKQTSHICCSHSAGVRKDFRNCFLWMLSVYIYSHKI